jgi:hypothetical protein
MEHWGPLLQTVLWVGLIGGTIIWANKPLHGILAALQKRIAGGSDITAGPFSIKDLKPQLPEQQVEKAKAEIIAGPAEQAQLPAPAKELVPQGPVPDVAPIEPPAPSGTTHQAPAKKVSELVAELDELKKTLERITSNTSQSQAYLAEDLAMRTIQADFNTPVRRQVTGGRDGGFDGVFETNGRVQIVEVKYIGKRAAPGETAVRIRDSLQRIQRDASKYGWTSAEIILGAVFASADIPPEHRDAIEAMCRDLGQVTPRFYTLGNLKRQWGMDSEDWDDKIYR